MNVRTTKINENNYRADTVINLKCQWLDAMCEGKLIISTEGDKSRSRAISSMSHAIEVFSEMLNRV